MTNFYAVVEQDIADFLQRTNEILQTDKERSQTDSIQCLSSDSLKICTLALEEIDRFIDSLSHYIFDVLAQKDEILKLFSDCHNLLCYVDKHRELLIDCAIDDFLFLDDHFDTVQHKTTQIIDNLNQFSTINSDLYLIETQLCHYFPATRSNLRNRLVSTLIEESCLLLSPTLNTNLLQMSSAEVGSILTPTDALFNMHTVFKSSSQRDSVFDIKDPQDPLQSSIQLDKININTSISVHYTSIPSFQYDLTDLQLMESRLRNPDEFNFIEQQCTQNLVSIWSNRGIKRQTIHPWSSDTFWMIFQNIQKFSESTNSEFTLLMYWCLSSLTLEAFIRDWDLFYSKALVDTITSSSLKIIRTDHDTHLSHVGHHFKTLTLRLTQMTSILGYMNKIQKQTSCAQEYLSNKIFSMIQSLKQRTSATFNLFIIWISQRTDWMINNNFLDRALLILCNDQTNFSKVTENLVDELKKLDEKQTFSGSVVDLCSSCQDIADNSLKKLKRRIELNISTIFHESSKTKQPNYQPIDSKNSVLRIVFHKVLQPILVEFGFSLNQNKAEILDDLLDTCFECLKDFVESKKSIPDLSPEIVENDLTYLRNFIAEIIKDETTIKRIFSLKSFNKLNENPSNLKAGHPCSSHRDNSQKQNYNTNKKDASSPWIVDCFLNAFCCQRRNRIAINT